MPSRKQRRRREKLKRHEYEYVVETEDGEEVVPRERTRAKDGESARTGGARLLDRRGRPVPKPSLRRVLRRALIFAPILVIVVYFINGNKISPAGAVLNALLLLIFFIPFSYMVDVLVYRSVTRRAARKS